RLGAVLSSVAVLPVVAGVGLQPIGVVSAAMAVAATGPTLDEVPSDSTQISTVIIESHPIATLIVDDERAGSTPLEVRLRPGDHELKLAAQTYADWTVRVKLAGGQMLTLPPVELVPLPTAEIVSASV